MILFQQSKFYFCSLSSMSPMRDVLDLLADMLQALNPGDRLVYEKLYNFAWFISILESS